jgi:tryptophanyl-tRNA synthetase
LSLIQPTGQIHIGNYFGALTNWVAIQEEEHANYMTNALENIQQQRAYARQIANISSAPEFSVSLPRMTPPGVFYGLADLHSITVPHDAKQLHKHSYELSATLLALGVDPAKAHLFLQSHVPGHAELCWYLTCNTPLGWLYRMTQFKDKAQKLQSASDAAPASADAAADAGSEDQGLLRGVNLGLLQYPVLMAADILIYGASHVPVGDDQTQHLELAREIARSFNHKFGKRSSPLFREPQPLYNPNAARVLNLKTAQGKMSKSDPSAASRVGLLDSDAEIKKKIQGAVTGTQRFFFYISCFFF